MLISSLLLVNLFAVHKDHGYDNNCNLEKEIDLSILFLSCQASHSFPPSSMLSCVTMLMKRCQLQDLFLRAFRTIQHSIKLRLILHLETCGPVSPPLPTPISLPSDCTPSLQRSLDQYKDL